MKTAHKARARLISLGAGLLNRFPQRLKEQITPMDLDRHARLATVAGLTRKLAGAGFLIPAAAFGAAIAFTVGAYVPPAIQQAKAASAQTSTGAELKSIDTSGVEKQSGEPATGVSLDASDYGIDASNLKDGTYTGSGTGFSGTITVAVTISGGKIVSIEIVSSGDDAAYLSRAQGVIPSVIAAQSTSVDTVSGATYSSKGILMAIKNALLQAAGGLAQAVAPATGGGSGTSNKPHAQLDPVAPANGYADGTYLGSAEGYEGPLTVRVTIAGGKISKIELVSSMDDEPYFGRAWAAIPGRIIDAQSPSVDTVSGATYSSEGIRSAVNDALKQAAAAAGNTSDPEPAPAPTPDPEPTPDPDPAPDPEPEAQYEDGTYTGYALCKNDKDTEAFTPYYLKLEVTIAEGKAVAIEQVEGVSEAPTLGEALDPFDEANQNYLDYAIDGRTLRGTYYEGVPAQLLAGRAPSKIDVVSRATYSSRAIAKAYADALDRAAEAWKEKHDAPGTDTGNGATETAGTDTDAAATPATSEVADA